MHLKNSNQYIDLFLLRSCIIRHFYIIYSNVFINVNNTDELPNSLAKREYIRITKVEKIFRSVIPISRTNV